MKIIYIYKHVSDHQAVSEVPKLSLVPRVRIGSLQLLLVLSVTYSGNSAKCLLQGNQKWLITHIHTISSLSYQYVFNITLILCLVYTSQCIFGAIWVMQCSRTMIPTKIKTKRTPITYQCLGLCIVHVTQITTGSML